MTDNGQRPTSSFIDSVARDHSRLASRASLLNACLKRVEGSHWNDAVAALCSGCGPLHSVVLKVLRRRLGTQTDQQALCEAAFAAEPATGLLHGLSMLPRDRWCGPGQVQQAKRWLRQAMDHPDGSTRAAVASLIVRQFPSLISVLVDRLRQDDREAARQLCYEGHPQTIDALMTFYRVSEVRDGDVPVALGLGLTGEWLAECHETSSVLAIKLARRFGYLGGGVCDLPTNLLRLGIDFVNPAMMAVEPAELRMCVNELMWAILGQTDMELVTKATCRRSKQGEHSPSESVATAASGLDLDSEYDCGLLFAAVRELDRSNLEQSRTRPSGKFADPLTGAARFFHASLRHLRYVLIEETRELAGALSVPQNLMGEFVLHRTAVLLEADEDKRVEAELYLRARWMLVARDFTQEPKVPRVEYSDSGKIRFRAAARLVTPEPIKSDPNRLTDGSPCLRAVDRLLRATGRPHGCEPALEEELSLAPILRPVGIEVQMPTVDDNLHVAWKEFLIECGVPSPRRRECGRMLEAALPPAGSWHAPVEFLKWLPNSGLLSEPQDLGIHVSLQGDLGPNARYLAFPQLFLNEPLNQAPRVRSGLRLVMSKGLVAINDDVVQCQWTDRASCRTELRVFVAAVRAEDGLLHADEAAMRSIKETQLIGSAFLSEDDSLRKVGEQFAAQVERVVQDLPSAFEALLHANYYEATGDPTDTSLLDHLPIVQLRESVRSLFSGKLASQLKASLAAARKEAADAILARIREA